MTMISPQGARRRARRSTLGHRSGIAAAVAAVAALLVLAVLPRDRVDYIAPLGPAAVAMYFIATALIVHHARLRGVRWPRRSAMVLLAVGLLSMAGGSVLQWRRSLIWPPRPENSRLGHWDRLSPGERARWASRLAAHALTANGVQNLPATILIPDSWPFPPTARVATSHRDGAVEVWAEVDGARDCVMIPRDNLPKGPCGDAPARLDFQWPTSVAVAPVGVLHGDAAEGWRQYRGDAARTGVAPGPAAASAPLWTATIAGPIRSSISVAGGLAIAGTHGNGILSAFDLLTGSPVWTVVVPNWIHQDPVSDGRVVLVGFGDKTSFDGGAPAGVAAFELRTGRHIWTAFDESAVMASPVIDGHETVYATAAGVVRRRSLTDGLERARAILPGGVIMGPPALIGGTAVFTVDNHHVCALRAVDLVRTWCTTVRGVREIGSAPTVSDGTVFVTAGVLLRGTSWRDFSTIAWDERLALVRKLAGWTARYAGQKVYALDLATGSVRWTSRLFHTTTVVDGHNAGTPTISARHGAVVMPIADTLVIFDAGTGATIWTAPAHGGRGPPVIVDGHVVLGGRDGIIESRDLLTGNVACTTRRQVGYDRAGPAVTGAAMIFGDLTGGIESMDRNSVVRCRPDGGEPGR